MEYRLVSVSELNTPTIHATEDEITSQHYVDNYDLLHYRKNNKLGTFDVIRCTGNQINTLGLVLKKKMILA